MTAKHGLGQNFLVSRQILERIVEQAGITPGERVLEIGPGLGFLTHFMLAAGARVTAWEKDRRLAAWLGEAFAGEERLDVIVGDFLAADLGAYGAGCAPARVIANLPYNITSPVFERLFGLPAVTDIIVMIQRQVAERVVAGPGTKEYGAMTLFAGFHAERKLLFHVSPGNFHPAPSVYSSVIRLTIRPERPLVGAAAALFFSLVRAVFSSRRKVLRNSLRDSPFTRLTSDQADRLLDLSGLDGGCRGEQLDMATFVRLAEAWLASGLPRPTDTAPRLTDTAP